MKLKSVRYQNFKGIKEFYLILDGETVNVHGDNETGKTTLMDGMLWLLTNKNSEGKADFDLKPLNTDGSQCHNLETSIEATFFINGEEITLLKMFREKWTQRRGAPKGKTEFTGHETKYFIDGVPKKKKDFTDTVNGIIGSESSYQLFTDPFAFSRMHWKEKRDIIMEVCGTVTDAEIIEKNSDLKELSGILGKNSADDHRAKVNSRRSAINDRMKEIPARIDELSKSLPDPKAIKDLKHSLGNLQQDKIAYEADKERMTADDGAAAHSAEIARLKAERENVFEDHRAAVNKEAAEIQFHINKNMTDLEALKNKRDILDGDIGAASASILVLDTEIQDLRSKWREIDSETFSFVEENQCPTCGQDLPSEKIDAAREKAESSFNNKKANSLEKIDRLGKEKTALLKSIETGRDRKASELKDVIFKIEAIEKDIQDLDEKILKVQNRVMPDKWEELNRQILAMQSEEQPVADTSEIDKKITFVDNQIADCQKEIAGQEAAEKSRDRIQELEKEEKDLSSEFEKLESELNLLDQFTISKVAAIEGFISSKFKLARFKMFDEQINGGIADTCQIIYNGVPWDSMNNAARINVGLDICNVLGQHHNLSPPIFIDNAESVTGIFETDAQQVRLYVDPDAKELIIK